MRASGSFERDASACIAVTGASNGRGAPVQTFERNGTVAQQWDHQVSQ